MKYLLLLLFVCLCGCETNSDLVNTKFCWRGHPFIVAGCYNNRCSVITDMTVNGLPMVETAEDYVVRSMIKNADKECP
jgi:hypothetical protein